MRLGRAMRTCSVVFVCGLLAAANLQSWCAEAALPEALDEWREWVLHGHEHRRCPFLYDSKAESAASFLCAWPGELRVEAGLDGGAFEQRWMVYGRQWVPLPGSAEVWPRDVALNGQPVAVVLRDGMPTVRLDSGEHRLRGEFVWRERPPSLPVADAVGLVSLTLDGQPVPLPRRDDGLWLVAADLQPQEQDALAVHVYRRVQDDVPTRLETVLELDVSGRVREERIGPALPAGFLPLAIDSGLPVRLDANGELRVQARPGSWQVTIRARADRVLDHVLMAQPIRNMPAAEVWSYQGAPSLRATLPEGGAPVDAEAAAHWSDLPAFKLQAGQALNIVEHSRGRQESDNELTLRRQLWLDFDRGGYTFLDRIGGAMRVGWRLDVARPYVLLGAEQDGTELLVTRRCGAAGPLQLVEGEGGAPTGAVQDLSCDPDDPHTGVEVRNPRVALLALGRIESVAAVPATGWRSNMNVEQTLNLPPGNRLLAALGVDEAPRSWLGRWRLLDFFVLLIVTVATARLFGRLAGLVALLALALSFHEPGAPVWSWLNLLAAVALARAAPEGRLRRWARRYRIVSMALLALFLVPFLFMQVRVSVYPQLEATGGPLAHGVGLFEMLSGQGAPAGMETPEPSVRGATDADVVEELVVSGSYIRRDGFDPPSPVGDEEAMQVGNLREQNAPTQAGPGRPSWQWTPYRLGWSGPVSPDRTMRLLVSPPWLTAALRLLAVAALAVFAAVFVFEIAGRDWLKGLARQLPPRLAQRFGGGSTAAALAFCIVLASEAAQAEVPPPAILEELQERLLAPPPCAPRCAEVIHADIVVGEDELVVRLQVHALASVAVPLPGGMDGWLPAQVLRNDTALHVRRRQGSLWVRLDAGLNALTLRGPLPPGDVLSVPFPVPPRSVEVRASGWVAGGVDQGVLSSGALELARLRPAEDESATAAGEAQLAPGRLSTFVRVHRRVDLGPLDWKVRTSVRRIAPDVGAINLEVQLLAGEAVVTDGVSMRDGQVLVAMQPTEASFQWASTLPIESSMALTAAVDTPWQEVWSFDIDSTWRVQFAGVPESEIADEFAQFHPRSGETLALTITKPPAVPGNTLAFDKVLLETSVGNRWRDSRLNLVYRSTRGGGQRIRLPKEARLKAVSIDGETVALGLVDGELNLPVLREEHEVEVAWQEAAPLGLLTATPKVELGAPASNIVMRLELPSRWLLFASGPTLGAAILYWSELLALLIVSLALGRVRATPLTTRHWVLLGLGFSMFSWLAFAVVAVWLLAHGARRSWGGAMSRLAYNLSQIGFGILTLAAFAAILAGIPSGLLGNPDMSVAGYESSAQRLSWFADRTDNATPQATVLSVPLWVYKALILVWALWLSLALMRWLPWIWQCFSASGLWRGKQAAVEQ